jgi:hypothetical protein
LPIEGMPPTQLASTSGSSDAPIARTTMSRSRLLFAIVLGLVFSKDEVKEKSAVVISYNAVAKTTMIWVQNGASVTVSGQDFMKAVWSIWFGKIDQPAMGDQLLALL